MISGAPPAVPTRKPTRHCRDRPAAPQRARRRRGLCAVRPRLHARLRHSPDPQSGARRGLHDRRLHRVVHGAGGLAALARVHPRGCRQRIAFGADRGRRFPQAAPERRSRIRRHRFLDRREPHHRHDRAEGLEHAGAALSLRHLSDRHLRILRPARLRAAAVHGGCAVALVLLLTLYLYRTQFGRQVRAVAGQRARRKAARDQSRTWSTSRPSFFPVRSPERRACWSGSRSTPFIS